MPTISREGKRKFRHNGGNITINHNLQAHRFNRQFHERIPSMIAQNNFILPGVVKS